MTIKHLFLPILIFITFIYSSGCSLQTQKKVCYKENCFYVELASLSQQRAKGLMFRRHLDYNKGMLFLYEEEDERSFWMKNTFIPLDIIWINQDKEVVSIKENAQPCLEGSCPSIHPDKKALYVLELNAGVVKDIGLKVGDKLSF
ncbi:MAG: DUF192 domain-containing protein [Candidatus Omnitrophota bacterium]